MPTPDINAILRDNGRSCARGAPMGDRNRCETGSPLYLQRLRLVDGDYGADGTYWGAGSSPNDRLWVAFNGHPDDDAAPGMGTRIYVRAWTRQDAVDAVLDEFPDVCFIKGVPSP